ncbi:hypothetical protein SAMN02745947_04688 [Rhodococcus rhodochrous J3]|uniref:Uncharacterized protein n=1 Tax=Rhodococcus rhodochrous J3 TaxID=903528 RepID=A0ABY1MHD0_RHORH|nr:hypothetical protein SAMN02745947_04688 [Rhodococcus rhodochrous J3]
MPSAPLEPKAFEYDDPRSHYDPDSEAGNGHQSAQ